MTGYEVSAIIGSVVGLLILTLLTDERNDKSDGK